MTYEQWVEAMAHRGSQRHLTPGLRVKGAWGLGTIHGRPKGAKQDPYVMVYWDRGSASPQQKLSALTFADEEILYQGIPIADCPECGIEAMIFYEGDYICAWCREQLEDGIGPLAD